ncbi:MAG: hypothetical protein Q7R82_00235 [Candidatus Daviesbacteria bacterium]|nr:hypothetical protein [Candidatus Daviesbacteria bacterium]
MNHLPFTLVAYLFNALSVLTNKFLLNKTIPDPLIYVFYISLVSFLAVLALPFTHIPTTAVFNLASLSTLLWTLGTYFMFKALKIGQVSRVIPVIGTAIPIILLIFASGTNVISVMEAQAVAILTLGMVALTITNWRGKLSKWEIIFEVLAAASFAFSYIILRQAYLQLDFFSVLVWSRIILLPFCIIILIIPTLRRKIIASTSSMSSRRKPGSIKTGLVFLGGQISGVISELLILFSISLANPALVNSLQGTQYVFLLVFALVLGKKYPQIFEEKYTLLTLFPKIIGIALIGLGLYLLSFANS